MQNKYKATKTQMLLKKARRYNIVTDGMIADLKNDNTKNSKRMFNDKLAAIVKGYEVSKNSYARNNVNGR